MNGVNERAWELLSKYLDDSYKEFVYKKFEDCFDYSPVFSWNTVIADIIVVIKRREDQHEDLDYKIMQVKNKFGGLRIYVEDSDDFLRGVISMAEIQCSKICNTCCSYGKDKIQTGAYTAQQCTSCFGNTHY
jgi:uncharacterized protein (DUF2141 family)